MPTFDGGHYFLTILVPIRTLPVKDGDTVTSPVHALRKRLSMLPTAAQTPACGGGQSPFARNTRNHFARFVIIDDVAYNGRVGRNTLVNAALGTDLVVAQPQDHLQCPFLLLAADFDAASGADAERDSYFVTLWATMEKELRDILTFCEGFDAQVKDGTTFAAYMAKCQLETTMSFNDYYIDPLNLPTWPGGGLKWGIIGGAIVGAIGAIGGLAVTLLLLLVGLFTPFMQSGLRWAVIATIIGAVVLAVVLVVAYTSVIAAGKKPFPTAPDSNLPTVLKSLHLQRAFTRFAIDNQAASGGGDAASAQQLYDAFKAFLAANKPDDLNAPTQPPGVIGI
jgi:hypothetical protein